MNAIKQLIREIHHRSLWQVLSIFVAASWGVLQVIDVVTETVKRVPVNKFLAQYAASIPESAKKKIAKKNTAKKKVAKKGR